MGCVSLAGLGHMGLIDRLLRRSHYRPDAVTIDLTYGCNLRCLHCCATCLARPDERELSAAELSRLFAQLKRAGATALTLTGGEPLTRPDWRQIVGEAARLFHLILYTNGTLVTEEVARELAVVRPYQVEVSVYGATEPTYEAVTGIRGSFRAFRDGFRRLEEAGVRVAPKFLLLKENAAEAQAIYERYSVYEGFRWDVQISPRLDGEPNPCRHRAADAQLAEFLRCAGVSAKEVDGSVRALPCDLGRRGCVITAYGDVWPCGLLPVPMGNVREADFGAIWRGRELAGMRRLTLAQLPQCRECEALAYCRPCWGLNLLESGDRTHPSAESCRIARLKMVAARAATPRC